MEKIVHKMKKDTIHFFNITSNLIKEIGNVCDSDSEKFSNVESIKHTFYDCFSEEYSLISSFLDYIKYMMEQYEF